MSATAEETRYQFGSNWKFYLKHYFSEERLELARDRLLGFLDRADLADLRMIDVGSGSGIHSLAAWQAKVADLVSFDYDPNSVEATQLLHGRAGAPANWQVGQGSILDDSYVAGLGTYDLVYSWGVLHHTGAQWHALDNAARLVGPGGLLYIALYTGDAYVHLTPDYWLDVKRRYNQLGHLGRLRMEMEYIWEHEMYRTPSNILKLPARFAHHKKRHRGMSLHVDIRDWLGGWPMEFSNVADVLAWARKQGLTLLKLDTGELNTEYLFVRGAAPAPHLDLGACLSVAGRTSELPLEEPFYIYGAGEAGRILLDHLKGQGLAGACQGFVDTYQGGDVDGLPTLSPAAMRRFVAPSTPVVVSAAKYGEIAMGLARAGYHRIHSAYPIAVKLLRVRRGATATADV